MDRDYIRSERFIHDGLVSTVNAIVRKLPDLWKKHGCIVPQLFTWPAEAVPDKNGELIEGVCVFDLETVEKKDWSKAMRDMVALTKAYGILLLEQNGNEVKALFETHQGSSSWTIPIERHGDVRTLGKPKMKTNVESVGILWSAVRPTG